MNGCVPPGEGRPDKSCSIDLYLDLDRLAVALNWNGPGGCGRRTSTLDLSAEGKQFSLFALPTGALLT